MWTSLTKWSVVLGVVAVALASTESASACNRVRAVVHYGYYQPVVEATAYVPATAVVVRPAIVEVAVAKRLDPEIASGSTLGVAANFLGNEPGFVLLKLDNDVSLRVEVKQWNSTNVIVKLPEVGITSGVSARIDVILPNGNLAKSSRIRLMPRADLVVINEPTAVEVPATTAAKPGTTPSPFSNVGLNLPTDAPSAPAPSATAGP